jgi:hypothetical protein
MNNLDKVRRDLQRDVPADTLTFQPLYDANDTAPNKAKALYRQLRRAKSTNNRLGLLVNVYYLGELLELHATTPAERAMCVSKVTRYYKTVAVRTYYLFEALGIKQVFGSKRTTTTMIANLSNKEFQDLLQEAITVAGARLLEEEVVNM